MGKLCHSTFVQRCTICCQITAHSQMPVIEISTRKVIRFFYFSTIYKYILCHSKCIKLFDYPLVYFWKNCEILLELELQLVFLVHSNILNIKFFLSVNVNNVPQKKTGMCYVFSINFNYYYLKCECFIYSPFKHGCMLLTLYSNFSW